MHLTTLVTALMAWSAAAAVAPAVAIEKRDDLECDFDRAPPKDDCSTLLRKIQDGTYSKNLQREPRNIHHGGCYVSWSEYVVGNAHDLESYVELMINSCMNNQKRSGIIKNVHIKDQQQKTSICLSNRASGCS
ncbi:hypothetical protein NLG97_g6264 [Lecanicillium saksenae]|uniref:Uncharacterized protein n=1 Tax=Lecanicillium saksenae TaxID=468837 RepID=A0ACC1QQP7_9HYPO|nr:hypothetical protein NLG97_g6264 [Lecanicillium saksenae]